MIDNERALLCLAALITIYLTAYAKRWFDDKREEQDRLQREINQLVRAAALGAQSLDPMFGRKLDELLTESVIPGEDTTVVRVATAMVLRGRIARVAGKCHQCGAEISGTFGCGACKHSGLNHEWRSYG